MRMYGRSQIGAGGAGDSVEEATSVVSFAFRGVQINAFPKMKQPRLINPMARMPHVNPIEEWKR
jgi:hypothetical protein